MAVHKADYIAWRDHPITQAMYQGVAEAAEDVARELLMRIRSDPELDPYQRGYVRGVQAGLEWEPEFIMEEQDA